MYSCFAPLMMAAALGQAPDQSAWLKSVPADVAVVAQGGLADARATPVAVRGDDPWSHHDHP